MTLTELIAGVEAHEKTLTVYNADAGAVEAVCERFADRNLSVRAESTPSGTPAGFVVLSKDGEFLTAAGIEDVLAPPSGTEPGFEADAYRPILDHLDETLFTSYEADQMLAASREIEDRAWRVGRGALHAGFQTLSILRGQLDVYRQLADRDGLSVHAYAAPEGTEPVPEHDSALTIHVERAAEIRESWFVVYDGAGVEDNKCALVAEEREPRSFYGFWTYDAGTVDWLVEYLETTYGFASAEPA